MNENKERKLPFSQRTGASPIPPQLNIGEISDELRRLIWYEVYKEFRSSLKMGSMSYYISSPWREILLDIHVKILNQYPENFTADVDGWESLLKRKIINEEMNSLFDFIEFLIERRQSISQKISKAFIEARAAYRIYEDSICAVGTHEQAAAFERAVSDADSISAIGARIHLVHAGEALAKGEWTDSVRESIHAVESIAKQLSPNSNGLGPALTKLDEKGYLHGSLKSTFTKLYGWTSDEEGVRHALIFQDESRVDETDALFMLGACASFVSYLVERGISLGKLQNDP